MATQTVSFSLDPERDADLAAWLDKHDRRARSAAIREKLRAGIRQSSFSMADVLAELREIKRMLRSGAVAVSPAEAGQDDDQAGAAVKGKLADLGL
jgi:hypothetical protein